MGQIVAVKRNRSIHSFVDRLTFLKETIAPTAKRLPKEGDGVIHGEDEGNQNQDETPQLNSNKSEKDQEK